MRSTEIRSQFVLRYAAAAQRVLIILCVAAVVAIAGARLFASTDVQLPQQAAAAGAKAQPVSLNPSFKALALAQGVTVGSLEWIAGGDGPQPSDTGSHPAYGWRHDQLLTAAWVRAVVSNYAARPCFYDGAPARHSEYFIGCRPVGWSSTGEVDSVANGGQLVGGITVCGFDLEHFPLSPLFAVAGSHGFTVAKPGQPGGVSADSVARIMLRYLLAAQAGMLRAADGSLSTYVCSGRAARYICGNLATGISLGCIAPADAATMSDYVRLRLLPAWMLPPSNDPVKGGDLQLYNKACWAIPALYRLALVTPPSAFRAEMGLALQHLCKRIALLQALVPGKACTVDSVDTWTGLTAAGVHLIDYEGPWEIAAMLTTGKVLGIAACTAEGMAEAAKWKKDPANQVWLVLPDGSPISWN